MKRKLLVTGAAGRIGGFFTAQNKDQYDFVLTDVRPPQETYDFPFTEANITDFDVLRKLCQGVDTVIHMAAVISTEATWEHLLPNNVIGLYNVYQAAHEAGCRRVVFASTINVFTGYPDEELNIKQDAIIRPGNLYGSTKAWGEAAGSVYADTKNLSVICLRFGWVVPRDSAYIKVGHPLLNMVATLEDTVESIRLSVEAPDSLRYHSFNVLSDNREKKLDISVTRELLGYNPQDDGFALAERNGEGV